MQSAYDEGCLLPLRLLALLTCTAPSDKAAGADDSAATASTDDTADTTSTDDSADSVDTAITPIVLHGAVAKGPLVSGSTVLVACIDAAGNPTGAVYPTETTDDLGEFTLTMDYRGAVEVQAEGYSFDEIAATLTSAPITLRAEGAIAGEGDQALYVNVVTHMAHGRIVTLLAAGASLEDATLQAENELRAAIAVGPADFDPGVSGTAMNLLGGDTDGNAYLVAVSAVVLESAWRSATNEAAVAATTQALLNDIAADLADDGAIDSASTAALADARLGGTHSHEEAGLRVAIPGDLDGDHLNDVLVESTAGIYLAFTGG